MPGTRRKRRSSGYARHASLALRSEALRCWCRQVSSKLSRYCVRFRPAVLQMCAASTPATLTAKQGRSLGNNTCSLRHCLARPCRARAGSEGVRGMQDTPVCPFTSRFLALRSEALRCWCRQVSSKLSRYCVRFRPAVLQMCAASTPASLTAKQGRSLGNNTCSLQQCLARPCRARDGSEGVRGLQDTPVCPFTSRFLALRSEALRCWRRQVSSDLSCYCVRFRPAVLQMCAASTSAPLTSGQGRSLGRNTWSLQKVHGKLWCAHEGSEVSRVTQDTPFCPLPSQFLALRSHPRGCWLVTHFWNSAVLV